MTIKYQPRIGDYGVISSSGLFARLIQFGTRSRWNHAFIYIGEIDGVPSIVEANPTGVAISPASEYSIIAWNQHEELTDEQRNGIAFYARHCIGRPYNWGIIFMLALRALGLKVFPKKFVHYLGQHAGYICSELVAESYEKAGVPLCADPSLCNPGDLAERLIWQ